MAAKSSKELDNIDTMQGLAPILKEFLEGINEPIEAWNESKIEPLEYISKSGFAAFDSNRGGFDLMLISDVASIYWAGHQGLSIDSTIDKRYDEIVNEIREADPSLSEDEVWELADDSARGECEGIAYRVRVMYRGNNTLSVFAGYDFDAPYFRWNSKPDIDLDINFKTLKGLKAQLKKIAKQIEKAQ